MDVSRNLRNGVQLMATTDRHSDLVNGFGGEMRQARKNGELVYWTDTVALVYDEAERLIDINTLTREEEHEVILKLGKFGYFEPDVMVFQKNPYATNRKGTRKAGCPDLVIEVWSDDNKPDEREKKFRVYSSSPHTEHWYVEQESDIVSCYLGGTRLPDQHLKNVLKTQRGLAFDISDLQTFDDTSWNSFMEYGYKGHLS